MAYSMQPPILNLKREEHSAGFKYAPNFRKCAILQFGGRQIIKKENRDGRRKCAIRERKRRRIALNHHSVRTVTPRGELGCKSVVVFETRHTRRETPQLIRRGTQARP